MVNKAKLDQILTRLGQFLRVLRDIGSVGEESFLGDRDKIGSAKYHFVVAIESCIDAANHIISSEGFPFPKDNADSFAILVDGGILPEEMRLPLGAMARFRNRLVHLYWDIDDRKVFEYLQASLDDLESFRRLIASHPW